MKSKREGCEVPERASGSSVSASPRARHRSDIVRSVGGVPFDAHLAEILLERADRVLAADGGRGCERVLTEVEIDRLLAEDEPEEAA